jgi:hypothetical protein
MKTNLLSVNADSKTKKGIDAGYLTGIMYLTPAGQAGLKNICPSASKGCKESCLYSAGRGRFSQVENARIKRTQFLLENRRAFLEILKADIHILVRQAHEQNKKPAVRLNGTSDLAFHKLIDFDQFKTVSFYDYTKVKRRMTEELPKNYSLTFSRSESNNKDSLQVLKAGQNVSVVFRKSLPDFWNGFRVIDGDKTDLRFLDPKGVVVGLTAKGDAKQDRTGFVVD